jgi:hypothetical protein
MTTTEKDSFLFGVYLGVAVAMEPRFFNRNASDKRPHRKVHSVPWGWSQRLIPTGERSGLQTHIATTESVSLCTRMES